MPSARFTGEEYLAFYDAAAPIVTYDSIDHGQSVPGVPLR